MGQAGANGVSIAAMISIFAALNGSILTGSRVPTHGRGRTFFKAVAKVHPQFRTPVFLSRAQYLVGNIGTIWPLRPAIHVCYLRKLILYGMTTRGCYCSEEKETGYAEPYHTFGYPIVPMFS